jgi:plastocyanin
MIRTIFFAYLVVWTRLVSAQYGDSGGTSMTTTATTATAAVTKSSSSSSSIQTVNVGKSGLKFSPNSLTVAAGDKVEFHFFPGDHSVEQASFTKPCHPLSNSSFSSGFVTGSIDGSVCSCEHCTRYNPLT